MLLEELIFWLFFIGGILIVVGIGYVIAGLFLKRTTAKSKPGTVTSAPERKTGSEAHTGPGWHCTWCWGSLPKGAAFCPTCGKELP